MKLMKELGYHEGYRYAHDYPDGFVPQEHLPERLSGRRFYEPQGHGYEKSIRERMEWLRSVSGRKDEA
jgi:putative ATPase